MSSSLAENESCQSSQFELQDSTQEQNIIGEKIEVAPPGSWEYDPNTGLFEFEDEFYAIYGRTMEKEGRFMNPETYVREFIYPEDVKKKSTFNCGKTGSNGTMGIR